MHPQKITIMKKGGYVYIMTNKSKTVLYTGVTNDLCRRVYEHQNHTNPESFTSKYKCHHCVYFEEFTDITEAIAREKAIKQLSREKKNALINGVNPEWEELATPEGIVRKRELWTEQVKRVIEEITQEIQKQ